MYFWFYLCISLKGAYSLFFYHILETLGSHYVSMRGEELKSNNNIWRRVWNLKSNTIILVSLEAAIYSYSINKMF